MSFIKEICNTFGENCAGFYLFSADRFLNIARAIIHYFLSHISRIMQYKNDTMQEILYEF